MILALITLAIIVLLLTAIKLLPKFNIKFISSILLSIVIMITVAFCIIKPKMHKPFSLSIIEYLIRINNDGSMSTTTTTTNFIKGED